MKQKRKALTESEVKEKSETAQNMFMASDIYKNAKTIMLYMPLGNEVSTLKIIDTAQKMGKNVLVPVTDRKTYEITPYKIEKNTEFEKGVFSLTEPKEKVAFYDKIDVVIVPGVAFDRYGGRIGFGKGCYDKFLKSTKALKIGFCYDFQLVYKIETDITDINMDYIITEKEFIRGKL